MVRKKGHKYRQSLQSFALIPFRSRDMPNHDDSMFHVDSWVQLSSKNCLSAQHSSAAATASIRMQRHFTDASNQFAAM